MRVFLFVLAALWFLVGLAVFFGSKSAIHEILAAVCMVVSSVFLVGSTLLERLDSLAKAVRSATPPQA